MTSATTPSTTTVAVAVHDRIHPREPPGAFFIVEADSLAKATEIAWLHPGAHIGGKFGGGIKIRPIDMLETL